MLKEIDTIGETVELIGEKPSRFINMTSAEAGRRISEGRRKAKADRLEKQKAISEALVSPESLRKIESLSYAMNSLFGVELKAKEFISRAIENHFNKLANIGRTVDDWPEWLDEEEAV